MKKLLIAILLLSATYSYAQTINAEQIKKDNVTIRGNTLHQLRADTSFLATKYYVDSVAGGASFDTTSLSNRINLKVDSVNRHPGTDSVFYYTNGTQHFAFIDSVSASAISAAAWSLTGNAGTTAGTNFTGTTDSVSWAWKTNNTEWGRLKPTGQLNVHTGESIFFYDSTAINSQFIETYNTGVGDSALAHIRFSSSDTARSHNNSAYGFWALRDLVNGWGNDAFGTGALTHLIGIWGSSSHNTGTPYGLGYENLAVGLGSQHLNHRGYENVSIGAMSLYSNIKPIDNIAIGVGALMSSTDTSVGSTAVGTFALQNFVGTGGNTAFGGSALRLTTTGISNVAIGNGAASNNTTGFSNTFIGTDVANANTTGAGHVIVGYQALFLNTTGSENLAVGELAGDNNTTQSNQVYFGKGYNQGSYAGDTTHTWIWGTDVQAVASNHIRLNAFTIVSGNFRATNNVSFNAETNTTAGDAATIDKMAGSFRKDASGTTFTLTNSFIIASSKLLLQIETTGLTTGNNVRYSCGSGSATITFEDAGVGAAPSANADVTFMVINP